MMKILKKTIFGWDCYHIPLKKRDASFLMSLSISIIQYVTSQIAFHDILVTAIIHLLQSTPVCHCDSG